MRWSEAQNTTNENVKSPFLCINGFTLLTQTLLKKNKKDEKDFITELAGSNDQSAV